MALTSRNAASLALLAYLALFTVTSHAASAESTLDFKEVYIIDGDTFRSGDQSIRLWGVNAPERGDPLFEKARLGLTVLIGDDPVNCKAKYKDRYNRIVMQCFVDGFDLASQMVQLGLAYDFKKYSNGHYQHEQKLAKEKKLNIWEPQYRKKSQRIEHDRRY